MDIIKHILFFIEIAAKALHISRRCRQAPTGRHIVRTGSNIIGAKKIYIDDVKRYGVKWSIYGYKPEIEPLDFETINVEGIPLLTAGFVVALPPKCPKCKTELKEKKRRFWRGWWWECVICGFKKKSRRSFYEAREDVQLIANRLFEELVNSSS